jgi:hypothetical protein
MPGAELDECRSYLPLVDPTARRQASDNNRCNRQKSKWRRRNFEGPMSSREIGNHRSTPESRLGLHLDKVTILA